MTEETSESTENTEEQQLNQTQEPEKPPVEKKEAKPPSKPFMKFMDETKEKPDKKEEPAEEKPVKEEVEAKEATDEKKEKKSPKKSASDRIQEEIDKRKELEEQNKEFQSKLTDQEKANKSLQDEIKAIKAGKEVEETRENKEKSVDYDEIREELEDQGWTDKQIKVYLTELKENAKLRAEFAEWKDKQAAKEKSEIEEQVKKLTEDRKEYLKDMTGKYPDLFDGEDKEGFPALKPEFVKEADKFASMMDVPVLDNEGKEVTYNPISSNPELMEIILFWLNRKPEANKKAKEKVDNQNKVKSNRVSTPKDGKTEEVPKKKGFQHYYDATAPQ
jgi:hypothetical protein